MRNVKTSLVLTRKIIRTEGWVTTADIENHAHAIAKLCFNGHKNIVHVFSQGCYTAPTVYYVDMELCSSTLADYILGVGYWEDRLENMKLIEETLSDMFDIMMQLAEAVRFIHSLNEVHRDIKPTNGEVPLYRD